jgi:hypothetical protein
MGDKPRQAPDTPKPIFAKKKGLAILSQTLVSSQVAGEDSNLRPPGYERLPFQNANSRFGK